MTQHGRAPAAALQLAGARFLIVEARYYEELGATLLEGARAAIEAAGATAETFAVTGALEIPAAVAIAVDAAQAAGRPYEGAIALGCAAEHAHQLIYTRGQTETGPENATPIGVTCRLCHRPQCAARSAPPIGRQVLLDDFRRPSAPFGFSDG